MNKKSLSLCCAVALLAISPLAFGAAKDYEPGRYANVREKAVNTLKYAYSPNRMFEKIASGKMSVGGYIGSLDPQLCEMAGFAGLDFVWIDMEHRPMTEKDILAMQMALEGTGCASLVRVRCEDINHVKPILDIGVDGIIFPQISSRAAAVRAVEACRYPQAGGKRGICVGRQSGYGKLSLRDYLKRSETWPIVIIELEDRDGLADLDGILALKDVDAIMVGPSDLACSLGALCLQDCDEVQRLVDDVAARTRKAGKLFFSLGSLEKAKARGSAFYCGGGCDAVSWRKMYAQAAADSPVEACEPKFSIFASDVKRIAKQRNVSIAESARMLKAAGVSGFDCSYKEPLLPELANSALKPVNLYGGVDFVAPDGGVAVCEAYLAAAKKYGAERVMIIPDGFREGPTAEDDYARIRDGLRRFAAEVRAAGIVPMVEDYGGTNNICSHMSYLKRMMDDVPQLEFALDSGNFYYAGRGEDILEMMRYTKGRIGHVHLKDQTKEDNHVYATLGLGAVPNAELVRTVASWGYDGWYTFENPVDPDRYADVVRQVAVVRLWVSEGRGIRIKELK